MTSDSWLGTLFANIDAKRTDGFLSFLTPDAEFRYGSGEPVVGHEAVRGAVDHFFSTIRSCSHRVRRTWMDSDSLVCQGEVTYVCLDGRTPKLPFCNVFTMRGGKIVRYEIYIDPSPLAQGGPA